MAVSRRVLARLLWLAVVLCAGLGLGAGAGYRYAQQLRDGKVMLTSESVLASKEVMLQREAELRYLRSQIDQADGELSVERAARTELENQLRSTQSEVGRLREKLAFYEQLLPPGPEGSVDVRGVELQHVGIGLSYKVLLMRSGRAEQPFVGALRFEAAGLLRGETVSVALSPLQLPALEDTAAKEASDAESAQSDGKPADQTDAKLAAESATLALKFDQYQRSEGLLALPEGFVPEAVTVTVLEGSTVRASRTVAIEF